MKLCDKQGCKSMATVGMADGAKCLRHAKEQVEKELHLVAAPPAPAKPEPSKERPKKRRSRFTDD